jgi:hypothetical protein
MDTMRWARGEIMNRMRMEWERRKNERKEGGRHKPKEEERRLIIRGARGLTRRGDVPWVRELRHVDGPIP